MGIAPALSVGEDMDTELVRRFIRTNDLDPIPMRGVEPVSVRLGGSRIVLETYNWGWVCFATDISTRKTVTWVEKGKEVPADVPKWAAELRLAVARPGCLGHRVQEPVCDGGKDGKTGQETPACLWRHRCISVQKHCKGDAEAIRRYLKGATNEQIAELSGVKLVGLDASVSPQLAAQVGATTLRPVPTGAEAKPKAQQAAPTARPAKATNRPVSPPREPAPKVRKPVVSKPPKQPEPKPVPRVRPGAPIQSNSVDESSLQPSHRMALAFCRALGAKLGTSIWDDKAKAGKGHLFYSDTMAKSRCISLSYRLPEEKNASKALAYLWPLKRDDEPSLTVTMVSEETDYIRGLLPASFHDRVDRWKDGQRLMTVVKKVTEAEAAIVLDVLYTAFNAGRIRGIGVR
jgi:hypothetical protein